MNWTTLVQVHELAAALDETALRIIDARFVLMDPQAGPAAYLQSHLPGAGYADLDRDLADLTRTGEGRHPLPEAARFARRVGEWGIGPAHQVVAYDAGDGSMAAARLWWMLGLLGHQRAAVLDGGLAAWRSAGQPESTVLPEYPALPPYPSDFDRARMVSASEVQARLGEAGGWLLDARAAPRFRGEAEPIDPIAGHVPGAVNRPIGDNLQLGHFKTPLQLRAEIEPLLAGRPANEAVLMCGSGVTACHLLLALEHAGLHGARVYPGSWSGWISDPARPITCGA